jgi:hypothetical protein
LLGAQVLDQAIDLRRSEPIPEGCHGTGSNPNDILDLLIRECCGV